MSDQYLKFFEALSDAAYIIDQSTGVLLEVNEAAARLYGYTRDEMRGLPVSAISDEPAQTLQAVRDARAAAVGRRHKRKDGSLFIAEPSASLIEVDGRKLTIGVVRDVTTLTNTFNSSPLMMSIADLATDKYLAINDAFCAQVGFSREEIVGRSAVELGFITPAERDALAAKLMAAPKNSAIDLSVRARSGRVIECRYWGQILASADGVRIFAAAEDVTEQRQASKAREEALSLLEKISMRVPGVVYQFRLKPDGTSSFPFSSEAIRDIYGVTPEEVRHDASKVFSRIHPDDLAAVSASIQKSARELSPWRAECRVKHEGGAVRWLRGDSIPEREADGSVLWHGFISDITEQREADEALRQSDERFVLAMDATSDGLWDWNIVTDEGYFSPGYYRMLGHEPGEFPANAQSWRDRLHPDDAAEALRVTGEAIEGLRERFEVEFRLRAKNGDWRWILGRGQCLARDASGRAVRMIGTHVDITEAKRLQAGLAQSDRLASMGMLAAGVAHEINNPLSYVLASLDALAHELPKLSMVPLPQLAELVEGAESALEGTKRIRKISRGLSTFSRVERVEREPVDLNLAIETAATMAHNEVKFRATLVKELGPVPLVLASDGKLAQVFLNLLINASHAIAEGDVAHQRITVRTWAKGPDVFAEVADTGHGIKPEHLERIFDPFFTTKKAGAGSGLGLSISKSIVTDFGGELRVESVPGHGARFIVRLPATEQKPVSPLPEVTATKVPSPVRGRILVVDDEEAIRRILKRVLSMQHEVVAVASGREGKELLSRDTAFDVVLCDLMMPEMTGMDLHAWLVGQSPELAQRVVFISGGAFTPSAGEYLDSVSNLKLEKPFEVARLLALMDELVRRSPRAHEA